MARRLDFHIADTKTQRKITEKISPGRGFKLKWDVIIKINLLFVYCHQSSLILLSI
jgi:hypothetical protein